MKKIFSIIIGVILLFCLSACKSTPSPQSNNLSESNQNEYEPSLIRALSATDDVTAIQSFEITHKYSAKTTIISDNNDLKFLKEYTYSHIYPTDELHELFIFPENAIINLKINDYTSTLYLIKDGSIVMRQMNGDSGVTDVPYKVYKADDQYMLDEQRLIELLKKYNGYDASLN